MQTIINDPRFQSQAYVGDLPGWWQPSPYPWFVPMAPPTPQCPNCGACPHCGRQAVPSYPAYEWTCTTNAVTVHAP